jgi:hypothetical protein
MTANQAHAGDERLIGPVVTGGIGECQVFLAPGATGTRAAGDVAPQAPRVEQRSKQVKQHSAEAGKRIRIRHACPS